MLFFTYNKVILITFINICILIYFFFTLLLFFVKFMDFHFIIIIQITVVQLFLIIFFIGLNYNSFLNEKSNIIFNLNFLRTKNN